MKLIVTADAPRKAITVYKISDEAFVRLEQRMKRRSYVDYLQLMRDTCKDFEEEPIAISISYSDLLLI